MNTIELVYGLGIAGAVIGLLRNIFISMSLKINVQALMAQVEKLIVADNLDRALKLCRAVPKAYLTSGLIPALEVFQKGGAKRTDLVQAYEQGVASKKPLLLLGRIGGVVGGLLAAAGLVLGILNAETVPPEAYAAPAAGLFFVVGGEFITKRLQEDAAAGFGKLLEVLKKARG